MALSTKERSKIIQSAMLKSRQSWETYTAIQYDLMYQIFQESSLRIEQEILAFQSKGVIPPTRIVQLRQTIKEEMAVLRSKLSTHLRKGMINSIDFGIRSGIYAMDLALEDTRYKTGIGTSYIDKNGIIRKFNPAVQAYEDSAWYKLNSEAMDALLRFSPDGLIFSDKVWNVTWNAQRAMFREIQIGITTGKSPASVARTIRGYLSQPDKLFRRVRKDGKLVLSKAAKEFHPGRGVYRSSFANAIRVSRTEYARAYVEGTYRYANEKTYIKGYISRVTSFNPGPVDAANDGRFFPKDDPPPIPYHPNCMCYPEIVLAEE